MKCLVFLVAGLRGPAAESRALPANLAEAEETYELRLERVLKAKNHAGLIKYLERELKERPRPYVKAWYANYLLYGAEFGQKDFADPARGFALAQEAAAEGSIFGHELVGRAYGDGRGTTRDVEQAIRHLREAAERDRHTAMCELGKFYFFGMGVPQDWQVSEDWMRKAAWRGAMAGMHYLTEWWETAAYVGVPNRLKANALYYEVGQLGSGPARRVLIERAKKGDLDAQKYVHLDFVVEAAQGSNPLPSKLREAVKWLEANSAPDDALVQLALVEVMQEKQLVVYDLAAARAKLAQLAAAGNDDAQAMQAMMTWRGIGEKADPEAAITRWRELAEKGNARALNQIGWLHWWGNGEKYGIPKDARKAFEYCKRSAELGFWAGQYNVAEAYAHGVGVEKNYFLAGKYYGILEDRRFRAAYRMKDRILALVKD